MADSIPPAVGTTPGASFFRRVDWYAFWTAVAVSFAVYFYTLAPTVTLEDSGELATASAHLGVPHPPGYPIWSIITWIFTRVFGFVTFRGLPNPAWCVSLVSAVFGALAAGFTAILICRSGSDMLRSLRRTTEMIGTRAEDLICFVAGVAGSLIFTFTSVEWSQSVINEVYSLNAFFLVLIMFLIYVWMRSPLEGLPVLHASIWGLGAVCYLVMLGLTVRHVCLYHHDFWSVSIHYVLGMLLLIATSAAMAYAWRRNPRERLLYLTAFAFGLGLTNYQVLLLIIASLALVVVLKDLKLTRDMMILGIPFAVVFVLCTKGYVPTAVALENLKAEYWKYTAGLAAAVCYPLVAGALCAFLPGRGDRLALYKQFLLVAIPYVCLGALLFGKVLLEPSPDDGIARTVLPAFAHPASGIAYTYYLLGLAALVLGYLYLPHGAAVAPTALGVLLGLAVYVYMPLSSETNPPMNWAYPRTWEGFLHAISRGQYERITPTALFSKQFVSQVGTYLEDLRGTFTLPIAIIGFLPFAAWHVRAGGRRLHALYVAIPLAVLSVALIMLEEKLAPALGEIAVLSMAYRAMIAVIMLLAAFGGLIMLLGELIDFIRRLFRDQAPELDRLDRVEQVDMDFDPVSQKWILVILSGFMVMSLVLVMLASPKGDIQDQFIQRVKFISSHALFAFWIGYGAVLGLGFVDTVFRGNAVIKWLGLLLVLMLPLIPIYSNFYNAEQIRVNGGAEQQGHDFGWQFGNYQLRGAQAILEELDAEEEPPPNPDFPRSMSTNAIFYGGTDPGRFVPTYMIYCPRVREDVYLITQNALADDTYMKVMRDLYGDRIWIPAATDSARAFQRYVDEVKSGARQAHADLKIENGRVQVSGALGVMEINGILAQMIFEQNPTNDFYVEESYVIPWMYPHLEPHGLILKINHPTVRLAPGTVRNDRDFWDWYTRRLTSNNAFLRDVVARKSFSKLRSAIAGNYAAPSRNLLAEAENAFQEARMLYPLSPEANFRLVQEVLMRQDRFDEASMVMREYADQDKNNDKVPEFLRLLESMREISARVSTLESNMANGKLDMAQVIELTDLYRQLNKGQKFMIMAASILQNTNLPAFYAFQVARMYSQANQLPEMTRALDLCIDRMPPNVPPDVYIEMARMYSKVRKADKVAKALQGYLKLTPADWQIWIDLARVQISALNQAGPAAASLQQAVRAGGADAMAAIEEDPSFKAIRPGGATSGVDMMGLPGMPPRLR